MTRPYTQDPTAREAREHRLEQAAAMYRQGLTLQSIGTKFGVTRERIRQILREAGIATDEGGQTKCAALRKATYRQGVIARVEARWGVPYDVWKECRRTGVVRRYETHVQNSKKRAIPFLLTFAQWLAIWQASGKLHLYGRGKGKYCMARLSDSGAYALGNVHVQLSTENGRDAVALWKGKTKENRGVFLLYPGRERAWFAKVGKKRLGFFCTEAEAAVAARAAHLAATAQEA